MRRRRRRRRRLPPRRRYVSQGYGSSTLFGVLPTVLTQVLDNVRLAYSTATNSTFTFSLVPLPPVPAPASHPTRESRDTRLIRRG